VDVNGGGQSISGSGSLQNTCFYPANIISPAIRVSSFITNAVSSYQLKAFSNNTFKNKMGLISQSMVYFYLLTDLGVFVCNVT
jgi:hypothetical protein